VVAQGAVPGTNNVRRILDACRAVAGSGAFLDDFSLLQIDLPGDLDGGPCRRLILPDCYTARGWG
jgi:hypothetical protein